MVESALVAGDALPPGYGTVNPFVVVRGARDLIAFVEHVLEGRETKAAHTVDADDLLIHAEVRVGSSTIMLADAKPGWAFTPALLQVYVRDLDAVLARAVERGAEVVTEATPFHGGQRLGRFVDPWGDVWWLMELGPDSTTPAQAPDAYPSWKPSPDQPPSYAHRTVDTVMRALRDR